MRIADEIEALRDKLEQLEQGPAVIGDWHRLAARIARALICGCAATREQIAELRILRMCVESRAVELDEAEDNQRDVTGSAERRC